MTPDIKSGHVTYPRLIAILAAVIVAAMILLTVTEPAHDIPNNRPAKYYSTQPAEPAQEG